jgi:hypothetical protein
MTNKWLVAVGVAALIVVVAYWSATRREGVRPEAPAVRSQSAPHPTAPVRAPATGPDAAVRVPPRVVAAPPRTAMPDAAATAIPSSATPAETPEPSLDIGPVSIGIEGQIVLPHAGNLNPAAGAISFVLEPLWGADPDSVVSLVQVRANPGAADRLQILKDGRHLRFAFADSVAADATVATDISAWGGGDRHLITATWGDGVMALYVDGQPVGAGKYSRYLDVKLDTKLQIGANQPTAQGNISGFQIYQRRLTPQEVAALPDATP